MMDKPLPFEQVQEEAAAGRIRIGIQRADALDFFARQSLSAIEARTGSRPLAAWLGVRAAVLAAPLAMMGASLFAILVLPWWTLMFLPAALAGFLVDRQRSLDPDAGLRWITLMLGLAIAAPLLVPSMRLSNAHGFILMTLLGFWSSRFASVLATSKLRQLLLQSSRAYAAMEGAIVLSPTPGRSGESAAGR